MKKAFWIVLSLCLALFVVGCSADKGGKKSEIGVGKKINSIHITLEKAVYTDKRNKFENEKPKKVMEVTFKIKNEGTEEKGVGAGDFSVFDKNGNRLELYGYPDNFGDVIQPGKELTGKAYYSVVDGDPEKIIYETPEGNEKLDWTLKDIKFEK